MPVASVITQLPDIPNLIRITRAIAMLDAILCENWEFRFYSFNSAWSKTDPTQMMASMRDGCGDEYFIWFASTGAAIKGFAKDSPIAPANNGGKTWSGILSEVPDDFAEFLNEPAFDMQFTTFCFWRTMNDTSWQSGDVKYPSHTGDDPDGSLTLLKILEGKPATYVEYARASFELDLDEASVAQVYEHK